MAFCSNCGHQLVDGAKFCPECGTEMDQYITERSTKYADKQKNGAVEVFAVKLSRLEIEDQVEAVKNFTVPYNKVDLVDFFVLAASNINPERYDELNGSLSYEERKLSDAWEYKFNQAYERAMVTTSHTPEFSDIDALYRKKSHEIERAKSKNKKNMRALYIGMGIFFVLFFAFITVIVITHA